MTEFSVEERLGDVIVRHTGDVTCPSQLGLARDGGDAREVCPLQNLCIGVFVLPADVKEVAKASEMEVVEDLFMGENDCSVDFQFGVKAETKIGT